jgi:hypothetical protein
MTPMKAPGASHAPVRRRGPSTLPRTGGAIGPGQQRFHAGAWRRRPAKAFTTPHTGRSGSGALLWTHGRRHEGCRALGWPSRGVGRAEVEHQEAP